MAEKLTGSSGTTKIKRKPRGRAFRDGVSGNPSGLSREMRAKRASIAEALDTAFTVKEIIDGVEVEKDLLVDAIKLGVQVGEPALIKLACEYRWGKPVQPVEIDPERMEDSELRKAVVELTKQWEQEGVLQ